MKGELFHKGIIREEDGYYIIRQSMPYPLAENNAYLIESNQGWSVIDVGIDLPPTRDIWEMAVKEVGISLKKIDSIYITHCHPDHLGASRWLQKACDAPVFMSQREILRANKYIFIDEDFVVNYRRAIQAEADRHGFSENRLEQLVDDWQNHVTPLFLKPYELFPINEDQIDLAGEKYDVLEAPGHCDGQVALYSPGCKRLFGADVLADGAYLHFTDWPNTGLEHPLGSLLDCLDGLEELDIEKVYPGHGACFQDLKEQITALRQKHWRRLDKVLEAVREPVTAGELYQRLYNSTEYIHHHRLLLGETLGYLEYLYRDGRLNKIDDGQLVRYKSV